MQGKDGRRGPHSPCTKREREMLSHPLFRLPPFLTQKRHREHTRFFSTKVTLALLPRRPSYYEEQEGTSIPQDIVSATEGLVGGWSERERGERRKEKREGTKGNLGGKERRGRQSSLSLSFSSPSLSLFPLPFRYPSSVSPLPPWFPCLLFLPPFFLERGWQLWFLP